MRKTVVAPMARVSTMNNTASDRHEQDEPPPAPAPLCSELDEQGDGFCVDEGELLAGLFILPNLADRVLNR